MIPEAHRLVVHKILEHFRQQQVLSLATLLEGATDRVQLLSTIEWMYSEGLLGIFDAAEISPTEATALSAQVNEPALLIERVSRSVDAIVLSDV